MRNGGRTHQDLVLFNLGGEEGEGIDEQGSAVGGEEKGLEVFEQRAKTMFDHTPTPSI